MADKPKELEIIDYDGKIYLSLESIDNMAREFAAPKIITATKGVRKIVEERRRKLGQ